MNSIAITLQQNYPSDTINSKERVIGVSTVTSSESRNAPRAKFKIPSKREINNENVLSYQFFLLSVAIQTQCKSAVKFTFRPNLGYLQSCKKFLCKSWRKCQSSCFGSPSNSWRFITATLVRVKNWTECSLGRILASSTGFYKFTQMLWKSLDILYIIY